MSSARVETAPAKVNLTLRVLGRRADGYHTLESLVVFASVGDRLDFLPGDALALDVRGPTAAAAGSVDGNLVLKSARALAERVPGLQVGRFSLSKELPVAAGLGGGSSDAAAALRLLAAANHLALDDPRVIEAAQVTGADVPVCLDPRPRVMRGIGEILSDPLDLPRLPAVLVNPGVAVPTKDVFAALRLPPQQGRDVGEPAAFLGDRGEKSTEFVGALAADRNDLEAPAILLQPVIADVLRELRECSGCRLARMSGSGATCFGLFGTGRLAAVAARTLQDRHPGWWVRATALSDGSPADESVSSSG
jgi:4-diphosphocytidyl-2-C-methyl-D-erythritol kinase